MSESNLIIGDYVSMSDAINKIKEIIGGIDIKKSLDAIAICEDIAALFEGNDSVRIIKKSDMGQKIIQLSKTLKMIKKEEERSQLIHNASVTIG